MNEQIKRLLILVFMVIGGFILKVLITAVQRINVSNQDSYIVNVGYIGSYISGITSLIIVLLTVLAVKYSYNVYMEEVKRVKQQRLEDRFYHLLTMHKENVNGMVIDLENSKLEGSKVILNMFREIESIVKILCIKKYCEQYKLVNFKIKNISERDKKLLIILKKMDKYEIFKKINCIGINEKIIYANIAFLIMFLGCGDRSSKILKNYLLKFENNFNVDDVIGLFSDEKFRNDVKENFKFKFKLFGGHQSRLGHYFRNMFHIVKFIDSDQDLSLDQKKSYIKNFRVQLNTFEQALLLVNSMSVFGSDWSQYIIKYKLVNNIPKDFFGSDYWFNLEDEVRKIAIENSGCIRKEYNQDIDIFMRNYFEFSKHQLNVKIGFT